MINNVLILDRDVGVRELIQGILLNKGCIVLATSNTDEAMQALSKKSYEILFVNLETLNKNGCGTLSSYFFTHLAPTNNSQSVNEPESVFKNMSVIITATYTNLNAARAAVRQGADGYIIKPLDHSEIGIIFDKVIEKNQLHKENIRLKKLNNVYKNSTETVISAQERNNLLQNMLSFAVSQSDSQYGSIMLWDKNKNKNMANLKEYASLGEKNPVFFDEEIGVKNFMEMDTLTGNGGNRFGEIREEAFNLGLKPFASIPLRVRNKMVGRLNVSKDNKIYFKSDMEVLKIISDQIAVYVENCDLIEDLKKAFLKTIESLTLALGAKDHYTHGHSKRVGDISVVIGKIMGLSSKSLINLRQGGYIHDIGKIGLKDEMLNKPGNLTSDELKAFSKHPEIGDEILKPLDSLNDLRTLVRHHHERFDGEGYPDHMKDNELTTEVRIISLVDAFDAMYCKRPYRDRLSEEKIIRELLENAGRQFAPEVVEVMLSIQEDWKSFYPDV